MSGGNRETMKKMWFYLRHFEDICLEGIEKSWKKSIRSKFHSAELPNTKQKY